MARIARKTLKQFGVTGPASSFGQFGSKRAGLPQTSQNPTVLQQLGAWLTGWQDAVVASNKAAYLEDMNGWCFVHSYMVAYLLQQGIPEWDTDTVYYNSPNPSIVQYNGGQWFKCLQDAITGNAPPAGASNAFWEWINPPLPTIPVVGNSLKANILVKPNAGAPLTKTDVTADLLSVQGVTLSALSKTADITASGAGGLDTGAPTNNTWYAVHIISNATGSLTSIIYSLSATAPTLPGGYTLFRRVGWVRRNGVGNFLQFNQVGDRWYWNDAAAFSATFGAGGTHSFATSAPPTAFVANFSIATSGAGSALAKPTGGTMPPYVFMNTLGALVLDLNLGTAQQIDFSGGLTLTVITIGYYDIV